MTEKSKGSRKKKQIVFHPLLVGLYPVLALLAYNVVQLDPVYSLRAIVITLLFSALVFAIALLITRDRLKGGLLASFTLLLFLTYGHVYNLLENKSILGHHRYLMIIWLVIFGLGTWLILRIKKKPRTLTTFLNYFSVVLIAIPVFQIARFELRQTQPVAISNPEVDEIWQPETTAPAGSPDVYYIILDSYSRSDMLKKYYGYDNSLFLQQLREMGFVVADCSMSNYSYTASSLASTLNMDYLDKFASDLISGNHSYYDMGQAVKHNKVRDLFSDLGYQIVTFDTDIWWLDVTDSDRFISQYSSPWQRILNFKLLVNFEKYYIDTTALRLVEEFTTSRETRFGKVILSAEKAHYEHIMFDFDQLESLPESGSPKFVYAHLVAPHFPFVFNPDGSFAYTLNNLPGYTNEIEYIDTRLLQVFQQIIDNSENPPVIIIQGDHGLNFDVRNAILNAYYLPGGGSKDVYSTITPVNTFRIVFNRYFGADYPLLPDVAYYASYQTPFDFEVVNYPCPAQ